MENFGEAATVFSWKPDKRKALKKLLATRSHSKLRERQHEGNIVPDLILLMKDKDANVRANAAFACAQLARDFPSDVKHAIPHLVKLLADEVQEVVDCACSALGEIGETFPQQAKHAAPYLIRLLEVSGGQQMACFAIAKIGKGAPDEFKEAVPKLASLLNSPDDWILTEACAALASLADGRPEYVRPVVPILTGILDDVRRDSSGFIVPGPCGLAAYAIGKIGAKFPQDIKEAVPRLRKLARSEEDGMEFIRENAVEALREIGEELDL